MHAIEKSKATEKATVDYSTLTVSQKFDAMGRLARATSKFIKPELLTCTMSEDAITLAWASEIKGIPVVNMETLEVLEAETFGITTLVIVRLRDMDIMTSSKPVKETEDKVQLALSLKHQKEVFDTLTAVDLGPLTRSRSSKE
jgi:hypothetical protein